MTPQGSPALSYTPPPLTPTSFSDFYQFQVAWRETGDG